MSTIAAADAGPDLQPGGQADGEVDQRRHQRDHHHAAEVAEQQRGALHRRQREPLEEAGLDVARQARARVDGGEQRALHERDRDREVEVGVGREARELRRRVEPADVDRQQAQREQDRRHEEGGLAQRLGDRPPRHLADLGEQGPQAGTASRSAGLVLGREHLVARLGQEDVVERRRVQLEVLDPHVLGVERAHHGGELVGAALEPHRDRAVGRVDRLAEAREHRREAVAAALCRPG